MTDSAKPEPLPSLSPTQYEALRRAYILGRLIRLAGGFWTDPRTARNATDKAALDRRAVSPDWSVGLNTCRALETRGLLKRDDSDVGLAEPLWRRPFVPTQRVIDYFTGRGVA